MMKVDNVRSHLSREEIEERKRMESIAKLDTDKLVAPKYFNAEQKAVFNFIKNGLVKLNLIDNLDVHALERYVISYTNYVKVSKDINRMGAKNENFYQGTLLLEKYNRMTRESAKDLGLSLSERLKLIAISKVDEIKGGDPLLQILGGN